jgi:hypothetical protein
MGFDVHVFLGEDIFMLMNIYNLLFDLVNLWSFCSTSSLVLQNIILHKCITTSMESDLSIHHAVAIG